MDGGQEIFADLLNLIGYKNEGDKSAMSKQNTFGQKLQRKYFSEITAEEMEDLVRTFESDFLLLMESFVKLDSKKPFVFIRSFQ